MTAAEKIETIGPSVGGERNGVDDNPLSKNERTLNKPLSKNERILYESWREVVRTGKFNTKSSYGSKFRTVLGNNPADQEPHDATTREQQST